MTTSHNKSPFRDPSLPLEERIEDLLGQLSLEEKCSQLAHDSPAIERLDIPEYNWWNEALHGVGRAGKATVFPQIIGISASWDIDFAEKIATAIADEARAKHHEAARHGSRQIYQGLTFWTPNINIFRDPRWGRGQETWGEDPYLTGEMGAAFVRGLQGNDPKYLKVAACAKHFAVHSGPEPLRWGFNAEPPRKDFEETYLPAFKRLVDEDVESFMGAYNAVYGEPSCASPLLLEEILRKRWGFKGHVVSDCWAIVNIHASHKATENSEESVALALKAGCDLNCGSAYCDALLDSVKLGLCSEEDVDRALRRLLSTRFKLGMFDPEEDVAYAQTPYEVVRCEKHQGLALEAARRSIIMVKNDNEALPLKPSTRTMTLVGPYVADVEVLMGNYFGISNRMTTLLEGITEIAPPELRIDFRKGFLTDKPNPNGMDWSVFEARKSDVAVVTMGLNPGMEGEAGDAIQSSSGGDRVDCGLPKNQVEYLKEMKASMVKHKSTAKIVAIVFGGSHIIMPEVHEIADAVLLAGYPGEAGGQALAEILFGKCSPEARLTLTVPNSLDCIPDFEDYSMAGRTYRFMEEENVLYPFGFGLTYTQFSYGAPQINGEDAKVMRVDIENTGTFDSGEIVQVYAELSAAPEDAPNYHLLGFQRLFIKQGEAETAVIPLRLNDLLIYDADGNSSPYRGPVKIHVGGASPLMAKAGQLQSFDFEV